MAFRSIHELDKRIIPEEEEKKYTSLKNENLERIQNDISKNIELHNSHARDVSIIRVNLNN